MLQSVLHHLADFTTRGVMPKPEPSEYVSGRSVGGRTRSPLLGGQKDGRLVAASLQKSGPKGGHPRVLYKRIHIMELAALIAERPDLAKMHALGLRNAASVSTLSAASTRSRRNGAGYLFSADGRELCFSAVSRDQLRPGPNDAPGPSRGCACGAPLLRNEHVLFELAMRVSEAEG